MSKTFLLLTIILLLGFTVCFGQTGKGQTKPKGNTSQNPQKTNTRPKTEPKKKAEPFATADVKKMAEQCVKLETEAGIIELEMFPDFAPETVRNFLNLVALGAFDTTTFSRVVKGFVIQGGNLSTREKFTPELYERGRKTIPDEPNSVKHERGKISMARSDEPNSATTSFFILVDSASYLDGKFSAFGQVTKGMDVVDAINKAEAENEKPKNPVRLKRAGVEPCVNTETPSK